MGVATFVVALNAVALGIDTIYGGASSGPPSSSYTTDGRGTAAFADLLRGEGRAVSALRIEPAEAELDPAATLFVLTPNEVVADDARALGSFVEAGGRLVVAVDGSPTWLDHVLGTPPGWSGEGVETSEPLVPVAETAGIEEVVGAGAGSWEAEGEALPALGAERTTVSVAQVGVGRVVLIADPSILHNDFLDRADNAAFGLAAAGDPGRPVLFAETFHGYAQGRGFGALPARGRWMLAGLTLGALLAMLAFGRRFGPADRPARDLPPARSAYVHALATTLARTNDHDAAIEALRARVRASLARRSGLPQGAPDEAVLRVAEERGMKGSAELLFRPVRNEEELIAAGKAAAKLTRGS